jgi:hypothetical protein
MVTLFFILAAAQDVASAAVIPAVTYFLLAPPGTRRYSPNRKQLALRLPDTDLPGDGVHIVLIVSG